MTQNASDRKELEARVKKAEADSHAGIETATAARVRAESEFNALRDLVQSTREVWAREVTGLKDEIQRAQTQMRKEREAASKKYEEALALIRDRRYVAPCLVTLVTVLIPVPRRRTWGRSWKRSRQRAARPSRPTVTKCRHCAPTPSAAPKRPPRPGT